MRFDEYLLQTHGVRDDFSASGNFVDSDDEEIDEIDGMSISSKDLFQKLKSFLNISSTNQKKRQLDDTNSEYTTLKKYRRLDSEFPRIIQKPFEDDLSFLRSKSVSRKPLVQNPSRKTFDNRMMYRFQRPQLISRRASKNSYADLEFSDDEEDEVTMSENVAMLNKMAGGSFRSNENARPVPRAFNIPIKQLDRMNPPPLLHINEPLIIPKLDPLPPSRRSFGNGLGAVGPIANGYHHSRLGNGMAPPLRKAVNSIMKQQKSIIDRESYAELLRVAQENPMGVPPLKRLPRGGQNSVGSVSVNLSHSDRRRSRSFIDPTIPVISLDDEGLDAVEVIDLDDYETHIMAAYNKLNPNAERYELEASKKEETQKDELPYVEPVNTLQDRFDLSQVCKPDWMTNVRSKWGRQHESTRRDILEAEAEVRRTEKETANAEKIMNEKIKSMTLFDPALVVIDEFPEPIEEEEEEEEFPELSKQDEHAVDAAIYTGAADKVLITKFNMNITRRDVNSLVGNTWLNDEVINFYMNLLTERSEQRQEEGLPRVYAMNTFFVPRLLQSGHGGVRRWTRKVDIFSYDILPVPVHVGGVHWCMAIINLKEHTIKYYDSMGSPNPKVLSALQKYLMDESMDKKKQPFDTSNFELESVADCPRQQNGSDCGVFSCMFAEYISRNRAITFSQQHMPYFRRKMILEIITGKLLL